jgi:hypothetical protein
VHLQIVTVDIKRLSLAFLIFLATPVPTNKTESGTEHTWGTTNSKPPGSIIVIDQPEVLSSSQCNLLHSFWEVHNCVVPFTRHGKLHEFGAENPIS